MTRGPRQASGADPQGNGRDTMPRLLTPAQVAERLAVSRSAIYAWAKAGYLRAIYVGRLPRFLDSDVLDFIAARRRGPAGTP